MIDPEQMTVAELLGAYAAVLAELRTRGVVRTNNAPVGDYAETLVAAALGGSLAESVSEKSYDLIAPTWGRVQVKARAVGEPPTRSDLQTSPFRSWDFDHAALAMLRRSDYRVHRAFLIPVDVLRAFSAWRQYLNGSIVHMTSELFGQPGAVDVTIELQAAADGM